MRRWLRGGKVSPVGVGLALALAGCARPGDGTAAEPSAAPSTEQSADAAPQLELKLPQGAEPRAEELAAGCSSKDGEACLKLGVAFSNGQLGLASDETRAADLYERACRVGDARGCNNLAVAFEKGQGRPKDTARACEIYQGNCDGRHALACRNLGRCFRDGMAGVTDAKKAQSAFERARDLSEHDCSEGVAEGCSNLGFMHRSGDEGLPKDEKRAVQYLQRACSLGYRAVCSLAKSP